MGCLITNKGLETVTLPYPLRGMIAPGQRVLINSTAAAVMAAIGTPPQDSSLKIEDNPATSGFNTFAIGALADGWGSAAAATTAATAAQADATSALADAATAQATADVAVPLATVQSADVTLVAGTATESTLNYTASSVVVPIRNTGAGTEGDLSVGTITPGTPGSAVINSANGADTSTVTVLVIG